MDDNKHPILTGEKTILRPITVADTSLIVTWRNNPEVKRWLISQDILTAEIHDHWMRTKIASGEVIQYIIEKAATKKPVGSVYFHNIDKKHNSAEYGIFIGDNHARGKGIGTEAARLFISYGFNTLAFHRISLQVFADNRNAYSSYEKAGFRYEGYCHDMVCVDGKYRDIILMAILSSDAVIENQNV